MKYWRSLPGEGVVSVFSVNSYYTLLTRYENVVVATATQHQQPPQVTDQTSFALIGQHVIVQPLIPFEGMNLNEPIKNAVMMLKTNWNLRAIF